MPDGISFVFNQKNTAPGPSGDLAKKARRATNTSAAFKNCIRNAGSDVNKKFPTRAIKKPGILCTVFRQKKENPAPQGLYMPQ